MSINTGFIGPGIMGYPMAINLIKGGHQLRAFARRAEALQRLTAAGATGCASPAEVAAHADIIFTIVSDTPDVEAVLFGEHGVVHGARPGSVVVDMSTISPTATKTFAARLATHGIEMLDAPVSGGESGAINATLSIMVGGKPEIFERVKPLFECMGKNIVHVGDNGAGQVAKGLQPDRGGSDHRGRGRSPDLCAPQRCRPGQGARGADGRLCRQQDHGSARPAHSGQ